MKEVIVTKEIELKDERRILIFLNKKEDHQYELCLHLFDKDKYSIVSKRQLTHNINYSNKNGCYVCKVDDDHCIIDNLTIPSKYGLIELELSKSFDYINSLVLILKMQNEVLYKEIIKNVKLKIIEDDFENGFTLMTPINTRDNTYKYNIINRFDTEEKCSLENYLKCDIVQNEFHKEILNNEFDYIKGTSYIEYLNDQRYDMGNKNNVYTLNHSAITRSDIKYSDSLELLFNFCPICGKKIHNYNVNNQEIKLETIIYDVGNTYKLITEITIENKLLINTFKLFVLKDFDYLEINNSKAYLGIQYNPFTGEKL